MTPTPEQLRQAACKEVAGVPNALLDLIPDEPDWEASPELVAAAEAATNSKMGWEGTIAPGSVRWHLKRWAFATPHTYRHSMQQELEELERTDPDVAQAAASFDATVKVLVANVHAIRVTPTRFECAKSCGGPRPHISEFRASDVQGN